MPGSDQVAKHASEFEQAWRDCHPLAQESIATKLAEALWREDIGDARRRFRGRVHAFDRVVLRPVAADPLSLVDDEGLRAELGSAVTGLALAYARRRAHDEHLRVTGHTDVIDLVAGTDPDEACVQLERLATEGHNLHPCGRTRLGWDVGDMLRHDLESSATQVRFLQVPGEADLIGDDLGGRLGVSGHPVHAWQLDHVRQRHPRAGLQVSDEAAAAQPTAAIRTLLLAPGVYLKLSLDIQVTSTRRTISLAATRNGPVLSALIDRLVGDDRVLLMHEVAGAGAPLGSGRELSAIVRSGLSGRLAPGEIAVPGIALPAIDPLTGRTVVAGLADRSGLSALEFLTGYARLVLPPVLRLAAQHGIGLEAHLQNCVPTFIDGRPHRLGLRDFAGLRVMAGQAPRLWPGSVIATGDRAVMLSKVAYTAFQAHLGELVLRLAESHDLDEAAAWQAIRQVVDDALRGHPDAAFYTAPAVPHKALTRMRLAGAGDLYVSVRNPLHG